jgi:MFS superfamily sulfate permease-like transporter
LPVAQRSGTAFASGIAAGPATTTEESIMPIQFKEENDGKILIVHVSGRLVKADYEGFVPEFERLVQKHGKLRLLFDMTDFHGWDAGAAWQDLKLGLAHFADIERLAMVGETKWQHGLATFSKPFTRAKVRYFDHADAIKAQEWLEEGFVVTHDRAADNRQVIQ